MTEEVEEGMLQEEPDYLQQEQLFWESVSLQEATTQAQDLKTRFIQRQQPAQVQLTEHQSQL
jgi:hypothetical protein